MKRERQKGRKKKKWNGMEAKESVSVALALELMCSSNRKFDGFLLLNFRLNEVKYRWCWANDFSIMMMLLFFLLLLSFSGFPLFSISFFRRTDCQNGFIASKNNISFYFNVEFCMHQRYILSANFVFCANTNTRKSCKQNSSDHTVTTAKAAWKWFA